MFLLDTNVLSEMRKVASGKADRNVTKWAEEVDVNHFISAITLFETEHGILRLARRDAEQAALLRDWQDNVILATFAGRILPVDDRVALRAATLHVPDPRPEHDAYIAATALEHDLIVVTRNVADFAAMGVRLFNPWGG